MKKWLRITLIVILSLIIVISAFMIGRYYYNSHKQKDQFDQLSQMVSSKRPPRPPIPVATEPTEPSGDEPAITEPGEPEIPTQPVETEPPGPLPEYVEVSALNPHMVGWLQIEGTRVDYPVMHTPEDGEYYLYKDFYGKYSSHGCLFIEKRCDVDRPSDNITIYGHNMKDGSMFAPILSYRTKSFWQEHRYIYFDTLNERHTYEVFAVFTAVATKGTGFAYHQFIDAYDQAEFDEFVQKCLEKSIYDTGIHPVYGEKLITLSTCEYSQKNGRFVVVARRVV